MKMSARCLKEVCIPVRLPDLDLEAQRELESAPDSPPVDTQKSRACGKPAVSQSLSGSASLVGEFDGCCAAEVLELPANSILQQAENLHFLRQA
jgi:hypothetical protein